MGATTPKPTHTAQDLMDALAAAVERRDAARAQLDVAEELIKTAVVALRGGEGAASDRYGWGKHRESWESIGGVLGMSASGAQQRFKSVAPRERYRY